MKVKSTKYNRRVDKNKNRKTKKAVKVNPVLKKEVRQDGVTEYTVRKIMTDEKIKNKIGRYFPEKHYSVILREDADVYSQDENGERELLISFRKKVLTDALCKIGIQCLKKAAMKKHDNRGAAAGTLKMSLLPAYANDFSKHKRLNHYRISGYWSKEDGKFVNNSLGNSSMSNIIGYFDKPDRNIKVNAPPCRETAFTSQQVDKWKRVVPLIQEIDKQFKKLIPDRHKTQLKRARQTPKFQIKDTSFSTVTINYNWRTALHTDAGDLPQGFGNLVVLEEGEYDGGYTGFPQYGVCVDVRHGDFLGMDVHKFHCNTEIKPKTKDYTRLSLVCYLREKMIRCKHL